MSNRADRLEPPEVGPGRPDIVRRLAHLGLALYLSPVLLLVLAIGGIGLAFGVATRAASMIARGKGRRPVRVPIRVASREDDRIGRSDLANRRRRGRISR